MNYDKIPELPEVQVTPLHRRRGWWLAGVALLVAIAGGWGWYARPPAPPTNEQKAAAAGVAKLEDDLQNLSARFVALKENAAPALRRHIIEEALGLQDQLAKLRVSPADSGRRSEWEARLEDAVARQREVQSRDLETEADELRRQKQPAAALAKMTEALKLQQAINRGTSSRETKSYGREAHLQQQIVELESMIVPG